MNGRNSGGSLVCGPETVFGTYLPQSWEVCKVYAREEIIIFLVSESAESPIVNDNTIGEEFVQMTYIGNREITTFVSDRCFRLQRKTVGWRYYSRPKY
jgi:hypothetical protein